MRLIIDTEIAGRAEANDFLHHVVTEINRGYVVGEGWELRTADDESDEEEETTNDDEDDTQKGPESSETGADSNAKGPEEAKVGDETTTPPEGSQAPTEGSGTPGANGEGGQEGVSRETTTEKEPWEKENQ